MSYPYNRHIPFGKRSRRYRKQAYIEIKNKIRRHAPVLGGLFTTHDFMHGKNGWIDGFFLGRKAPIFYNFVLDTTRNMYKERVRELAFDRSYEIVPDCEFGIFDAMVTDSETGMWTTTPADPMHFTQFGGLSRDEWVEQQIPIIANERVVQVFEEWTLHNDYGYGVGLHATIDVPYLTIEAVNDFIPRFMEFKAVFHSRVALTYSHDEIERWGIESNAIVDPDKWQE
ncbi:MAG: hypothetical protein NT123_05310 [Proteobacteria bacterium]|nr:hypothetical protein [Pseudomonadota bacterium]